MTAMRPDGAHATQAAKGLVNGHVEPPVSGGPEHTDYYSAAASCWPPRL